MCLLTDEEGQIEEKKKELWSERVAPTLSSSPCASMYLDSSVAAEL